MSLFFATDGTDLVDCGSAAVLDNLTTGTVLGWIKWTSFSTISNSGCLASKGNTSYTGNKDFTVTNAGRMDLVIQRNTSDLRARSATGFIVTNIWHFLAFSFNTAGVDANQHLYLGTENSIVAETPTYTLQTVGSGTVKDDSASSFCIGNLGTGIQYDGGGDRLIELCAVWNRQLTLAEIVEQQMRAWPSPGCIGLWRPGSGPGKQPDLSGWGNHGTIQGAVIRPAANLRIVAPRHRRHRYVAAAGGSSVNEGMFFAAV